MIIFLSEAGKIFRENFGKKARRKRSSDLVAVWKFLTALSRDDKKGDVSCQGPVQLSLSIDCAGEKKVSDFW